MEHRIWELFFFLLCGKILVLDNKVQPITFYCRSYGHSNCTKFMSVHIFKDLGGRNADFYVHLINSLGPQKSMFGFDNLDVHC